MIKQIAVYQGGNWVQQPIGVDAANVIAGNNSQNGKLLAVNSTGGLAVGSSSIQNIENRFSNLQEQFTLIQNRENNILAEAKTYTDDNTFNLEGVKDYSGFRFFCKGIPRGKTLSLLQSRKDKSIYFYVIGIWFGGNNIHNCLITGNAPADTEDLNLTVTDLQTNSTMSASNLFLSITPTFSEGDDPKRIMHFTNITSESGGKGCTIIGAANLGEGGRFLIGQEQNS